MQRRTRWKSLQQLSWLAPLGRLGQQIGDAGANWPEGVQCTCPLRIHLHLEGIITSVDCQLRRTKKGCCCCGISHVEINSGGRQACWVGGEIFGRTPWQTRRRPRPGRSGSTYQRERVESKEETGSLISITAEPGRHGSVPGRLKPNLARGGANKRGM